MSELSVKNLKLSFGGAPLLDGLELHVAKGERIALLGRNGCGKSTFLRVLSGALEADEGEITKRPGLRITGLEQDVPGALSGTVGERIAEAAARATEDNDWEREERVTRLLSELRLDPDALAADLSAGTKRRLMLACALVAQPDVLILDEPTNHLDIEAISKLEERLAGWRGSLIFVSHDRAFTKRLANRVVDLDRGRLKSYDCAYETYLERKSADLDKEERDNTEFDKKLAKEEVWLKRGVKARRTRNQGRVRALMSLRKERADRREKQGKVNVQLQQSGRTGTVVIRTKEISKAYGEQVLFENLSLEIQRGDRIGFVGPNGCGKTTLLRVLLDELEADSGDVRHGTKLEVARFDQLHMNLDPNKTLQENVCEGGDTVQVGEVSRHIMGYLQDFLFTPAQILGPIDKLSGGERNRLQLAKILARPCNVLVLDEPTNDLDLETLELLEELLMEFKGTLLLVSHDREFLDNVVTSTLVFEEGAGLREFVGGYSDWRECVAEVEASNAVPEAKPKQAKPKSEKPLRLTFNEKRELEGLPAKIEELETEKGEVEAAMAAPEFYQGKGDEVRVATVRLAELTEELEAAYERWTSLESIAEA